ncbi:hypothetical protein SAMN04487896_4239 [Paenibacillus sp. ov031]|uniref:hypothetical protein n=1 Tax=Paenibacillus sp. ov031 TaxID=1761879 RepID=UPI0009144103|nr:hypothetical protein [Paenibacillus sp. ov031]SHN79320.1 hypothetical protein SAMN04487896_4239 [Paenibacillus sp. ov031]
MKHMDDEWEKVVKQEPFAASPFTEEHKQNVLRQVAWLKSGSAQKMSDVGDKSAEQNTLPNQHRRRLRSRRAVIACTTIAAVAAAVILWNGQIVEPVIEKVYPTAALQYTDDAGMSLLTDKMKKNVAVTMRDYLGKQLRITKVQDLPVSGRVSVEAGKEGDAEYALIWLDAATGNLREVQMRREMAANELEHRYLRQIPSLLQGIGGDPALTPLSANRYVGMKQGELEPKSYTTLTLENKKSYGEIIWLQDEAISVSGDLDPDQVSQTALANAEDSIEAFSGKTAPDLTSIHRTKDDENGKDTFTFNFGDRYFVQTTEGKSGLSYSVMNAKYNRKELNTMEEMEAYHKELLEMKESILREKAAPIIKKIFNVDLQAYKLRRMPETLGIVSFELESTTDAFQIEYNEDARITMIKRDTL